MGKKMLGKAQHVPLNEEQLDAVSGGNAEPKTGELASTAEITPTTDIHTVLMMVQAERVKLLDSQLIDQMKQVQNRNEAVRDMNTVLAELKQENTDDGNVLSLTESRDADNPDGQTWADVLHGVGITDADADGNGSLDKTEIDNTLTALKGRIEGEAQNQQMDMLRLQSLMNKRHEAHDLMTSIMIKRAEGDIRKM